jgi:hypothetical protein
LTGVRKSGRVWGSGGLRGLPREGIEMMLRRYKVLATDGKWYTFDAVSAESAMRKCYASTWWVAVCAVASEEGAR